MPVEPGRGQETPPPPRPQKLTPRDPQSNSTQRPPIDHHQPNVRQPDKAPFDPQKWRDQLQAKRNSIKKSNDPLIFQYPTPYKTPDWLKVYS